MRRTAIWGAAFVAVAVTGWAAGHYLPISPLSISFGAEAQFDPIGWLIGSAGLAYAYIQSRTARHTEPHADFAPPPDLPWFTLDKPARPEDLQPFAALNCWARLPDGEPVAALVGRETERKALLVWARSGPGVRVKVVSGEGGFGKSRLAAEVAHELAHKDRWAAGLHRPHSDEDRPGALPRPGKGGLFLILDYPEEQRPRVRAVLEAAKALGKVDHPVRIVLLTRQAPDAWQTIIDEIGIDPQSTPLNLPPLTDDPARDVYWVTRVRLADHLGVGPPTATTTDFARWREDQRELGRRPLIVLAATVHAVLHPDTALKVPAAEVVRALVRREARRLDKAGIVNGFGEGAGEMLAALAAVRGGLDGDALRALAADRASLEIGLPDADKVVASARAAGWLRDGTVPEPKPDIMAAVLVHDALHADDGKARDRLWSVLRGVMGGRLDALGRIAYDLLLIEGAEASNRFVGWLVRMIEGRADRVAALAGVFTAELPILIAPIAAAWGKEARKVGAVGESSFAQLLNNHSNYLAESGDGAGALAAISEAVEIRRRLARATPARFEPDLAMSLNNLSSHLSESGDGAGALAAISEAVEIHRRLARATPARFEPDLAASLNNLSNRLSESGDGAGALAAISEAVEIYRRLARATPARFEPDLARSQGSLGRVLEMSGKTEEARNAYDEGARIVEPHAKARPGTPVEALYRALCANRDRLGGG